MAGIIQLINPLEGGYCQMYWAESEKFPAGVVPVTGVVTPGLCTWSWLLPAISAVRKIRLSPGAVAHSLLPTISPGWG